MPWNILTAISEALDAERCWLYARTFHFALGDGAWTISIRPDSAGRFRVDTCHLGVVCDTRWCRDDDGDRLTALVLTSRDEVLTAL